MRCLRPQARNGFTRDFARRNCCVRSSQGLRVARAFQGNPGGYRRAYRLAGNAIGRHAESRYSELAAKPDVEVIRAAGFSYSSGFLASQPMQGQASFFRFAPEYGLWNSLT